MIHPVTYINKLLFSGGDAGNCLQLWNVIEQKMVFEFKMKGESSITCLQQSPVVDIVAVGCADGQIHLMNLRFNSVLLSFTQKEGPIASLSFLTDTRLEVSLLASTSKQSGSVALWDLNAKKIHCEIKAPHGGKTINTLCFLDNEPVLLTASE